MINFKILNLRFKHFSIDLDVNLYVLLVCVTKDDEKERKLYALRIWIKEEDDYKNKKIDESYRSC